MNYQISQEKKLYQINAGTQKENWSVKTPQGNFLFSNVKKLGTHLWEATHKNKKYLLQFNLSEGKITLWNQDEKFSTEIKSEAALVVNKVAGKRVQKIEIKSVMPGLIKSIHVKPGEKISKSKPLLILEAMKMENEMLSPVEGIVEKIHVQEKQSVEGNTLLITLK